jgi:hypothetical protein
LQSIIPVTGDFGGTKAIGAVAQYLKDRDAVVTAFYVSNVESYLFRVANGRLDAAANGGSKEFYDNVSALPLDSSSTFIRSWNGVFGPMPPGGMPYTVLSPMQEMSEASKREVDPSDGNRPYAPRARACRNRIST